jgi:hypothetical protein
MPSQRWRHCSAVLVLGLVLTGAEAPLPAAELLDRVVALVSGAVITLSAARTALAFGLVEPPSSGDPVAAAVKWLIDRQLVLDEASRYETGEIDQGRIEARMESIKAALGGDRAFEAMLDRLGLTRESARTFVLETMRTEEYVSRRFEAVLVPSTEELRDYYARHAGELKKRRQ